MAKPRKRVRYGLAGMMDLPRRPKLSQTHCMSILRPALQGPARNPSDTRSVFLVSALLSKNDWSESQKSLVDVFRQTDHSSACRLGMSFRNVGSTSAFDHFLTLAIDTLVSAFDP